MAEHVGRIPLAKRRRRKKPNRNEGWAVFEFLFSFVRIAIMLYIASGEGAFVKGLCGAIVVLSLVIMWAIEPVAVPALKRWLWGDDA